MDANQDLPQYQTRYPPRASVTQHDILEIERKASTQNKDKNQNKTMKVN